MVPDLNPFTRLVAYLLLGCLCFASFFFFQSIPAIWADGRFLVPLALLWILCSVVLSMSGPDRQTVPVLLEIGARILLYSMVGALAAFLLFVGLIGEFAYYGLLAIPLLAGWVAAAIVIGIVNVSARVRRAYVFGSAGILAASVVLTLLPVPDNPPTVSKYIMVPLMVFGTLVGVAIGAAPTGTRAKQHSG
jgi:hypothetical protein